MPIYEYECGSCDTKFEQFRAISGDDKDVKCPNCGKRNARRIVSRFFGKNAADSSCGPASAGG